MEENFVKSLPKAEKTFLVVMKDTNLYILYTPIEVYLSETYWKLEEMQKWLMIR